jgi:hypothetical protein
MLRPRVVTVVAALAVACALLIGAPPSTLARKPLDCRAFADMPYVVTHSPTHPRMRAWAEFHCASASALAVHACAARLPYAVDPKPIWCGYSRVKVAAGGKAFARTLPHDCVPGARSMSYVRIVGHAWDQGPYAICR